MANKKKTTAAAREASTKEYRDTAVKLAQAGNKSTAEVARELGLPPWKLYGWVQTAEKSKTKGPSASGGAGDELRRLQKRNKELEQEVEILKKAAAYFAKNLP
jgi:transposase